MNTPVYRVRKTEDRLRVGFRRRLSWSVSTVGGMRQLSSVVCRNVIVRSPSRTGIRPETTRCDQPVATVLPSMLLQELLQLPKQVPGLLPRLHGSCSESG